MSYSYLQSVFPNYRPSQKLTELIYNDIVNTNRVREPAKYDAANDTPVQASLSNINSNPLIVDEKTEKKDQSKENDNEKVKIDENKTLLEMFKDNLKFYNEPLKTSFIETLENTEESKKSCEDSCVENINHILKCEDCSAIIKHKLGLINPNPFNEYLEILMYILFGLFIIAILDKLDKR